MSIGRILLKILFDQAYVLRNFFLDKASSNFVVRLQPIHAFYHSLSIPWGGRVDTVPLNDTLSPISAIEWTNVLCELLYPKFYRALYMYHLTLRTIGLVKPL